VAKITRKHVADVLKRVIITRAIGLKFWFGIL